MRTKPTPSSQATEGALDERRAELQGNGTVHPLKKLKGALGRPVALQWRNGQPHVVLVDRRSGARLQRSDVHLCAELRARLLAQEADETSKLLRDLVEVHDKLTRAGWAAVSALPATKLHRAAMQAHMLSKDDPSPALAQLAERLRMEHAAAQMRDQKHRVVQASQPDATPDDADPGDAHRVDVKETSYEEFEEVERSWTRTMPSDLAPLSADR